MIHKIILNRRDGRFLVRSFDGDGDSVAALHIKPHHIAHLRERRGFRAVYQAHLAAEAGSLPHQAAHGPSMQRVLIGQNIAELFHERISFSTAFPPRKGLYPSVRRLASLRVFSSGLHIGIPMN